MKFILSLIMFFHIAFATLLAFATPYYVITVHVEPRNYGGNDDMLRDRDFNMLGEIVTAANYYGIKLTILYSAESAQRILSGPYWYYPYVWTLQGHEAGIHHHAENSAGIDWDGYTWRTPAEAHQIRINQGHAPESYRGDLWDLQWMVESLGVGSIVSGHWNAEQEPRNAPPWLQMTYCPPDTWPQLPGMWNGQNDGVITVNGRNCIKMAKATTPDHIFESEAVMGQMSDNQIYGIALDCMSENHDQTMQYIYHLFSWLGENDPGALKSRTLYGAINRASIAITR